MLNINGLLGLGWVANNFGSSLLSCVLHKQKGLRPRLDTLIVPGHVNYRLVHVCCVVKCLSPVPPGLLDYHLP